MIMILVMVGTSGKLRALNEHGKKWPWVLSAMIKTLLESKSRYENLCKRVLELFVTLKIKKLLKHGNFFKKVRSSAVTFLAQGKGFGRDHAQ